MHMILVKLIQGRFKRSMLQPNYSNESEWIDDDSIASRFNTSLNIENDFEEFNQSKESWNKEKILEESMETTSSPTSTLDHSSNLQATVAEPSSSRSPVSISTTKSTISMLNLASSISTTESLTKSSTTAGSSMFLSSTSSVSVASSSATSTSTTVSSSTTSEGQVELLVTSANTTVPQHLEKSFNNNATIDVSSTTPSSSSTTLTPTVSSTLLTHENISLSIPKVCNETVCIKASRDLEEDINKNSCSNVKQYVCGKHNEDEIPDDQSSWGFLEEEQQLLFEKVKAIMESNVESDWHVMRKARIVYKACMDIGAIDVKGEQLWRSFADQLGGVPITQGFWREVSYDWIEANSKMMRTFSENSLIRLLIESVPNGMDRVHVDFGGPDVPRSVLLSYENNPPLLQAWVDLFYRSMDELWPEEPIKPAKLVSVVNGTNELPAPAKLTHFENETNPEQILPQGHRTKRSFLWMFPTEKHRSGVKDRVYFDILANETIKLEIELAAIVEHFSKVETINMTFDEFTNYDKEVLDVKKLLNGFLESPENYTYVTKPKQLRALAMLLSTYQPRDIANVLGWRALYKLLDHMPHRFRRNKQNYDKIRYLLKKAPSR